MDQITLFCTWHATLSRIIVEKEKFGFWQVLRIVIPYFGHAGQVGFLIYVSFMLLYQFGLDDCYHELNDYPFCPRFHLRDRHYLTFDVCHELA
jgi:hypothetical protein